MKTHHKLSTHAAFFGLLRKLPHLSKSDLVWEYSNMLTDSLSEFHQLNPEGYAAMIYDLQKMAEKMKQNPKTEIKKLRSGILHRLQKHGVDTTNWNEVNRFMEQPRIAGKKLYEMSIDEMKDLIKKLENILKKDERKQAEIQRLTQQN